VAEVESLRGAVSLAHYFLRQRLRPGDRVLDATCGNGQDTLLLAESVGEEGEVWAFDVQPRAIEATRALLERHGRLAAVRLVEAGHETLGEVVPDGLAAAVFNLGFLPGGDSTLVTAPHSTVAALVLAAQRLKVGGIITVALYTGHAGGPEEADAVAAWGSALSPREFNVWTSRQLNRPVTAPYLAVVERVR
jgi:SAM-dependent methyltransferase